MFHYLQVCLNYFTHLVSYYISSSKNKKLAITITAEPMNFPAVPVTVAPFRAFCVHRAFLFFISFSCIILVAGTNSSDLSIYDRHYIRITVFEPKLPMNGNNNLLSCFNPLNCFRNCYASFLCCILWRVLITKKLVALSGAFCSA